MALDEIESQHIEPRYDEIVRPRGASVWHRAVRALLGCPAFTINTSARWLATMAGYGALVALFDECQVEGRAKRSAAARLGITSEETPTSVALNNVMARIRSAARKSVTMEVGQLRNITGVGDVLKITYRGQDITSVVIEKFWEPERAMLMLAGADVEAAIRYRHVGVTYTRLGSIAQALLAGPGLLVVDYIPQTVIDTASPGNVDNLKELLSNARKHRGGGSSGRVQGRSPEWTWYKLTEYLQVEICQRFGASLESTPWYRYPFVPVIQAFAAVIGQEFSAVRRKHGILRQDFPARLAYRLSPALR